jgi:hypothetical protein
VLYSAGYVHRNISVRNVLLCGQGAKISDLKYVRPFEVTLATADPTPKTEIHDPKYKELKTVRSDQESVNRA